MAASTSKNSAKSAKDKSDDEVKELSASDLSPKELEQAISQQATAADSKQKTETPAEELKPKEEDDEDSGTPIIVRRRNNYLNQQTSSGEAEVSKDSETAPKAPSQERTVIQPPSASQQPDEDETKKPQAVPSEAADTENTTTQNTAEQTPKEEKQSKAEDSSDTKPEETPPTPKEEPVTEKPTPPPEEKTPPPTPEQMADDHEQQKPTVFDTSEYHLPIRERSRNYVSGTVSWIILLLVLAVAAGIVMYGLGILELNDISFSRLLQ